MSRLTARPRRCAAGRSTIVAVATVPNIAQPTPAMARNPRNTPYVEVITLATSLNAITSRPETMSGRRPSRPSRYPVGKLATHFPAPNTVGMAVTIR